VVILADAIIHPLAMMIEALNTSVADEAVP
jgi:hypothetical protein